MVGRMGRLVEDLLEISQIASGRLAIDIELEEIDLAALVREVAARFAPAAERAGSAVAVSGLDRCPGRWDRLRLEQVVIQLLSNALKYGAGHPVEVTLGADGGVAHLTVRDHGLGIDPAVREQIFQRFERAVSTRHYGGFGLGLWIAREVAEAHGGRIFVESEPGKGASFTLVLPSGPSRQAAEASPAGPHA
jgi:signal transduction histidine kinase